MGWKRGLPLQLCSIAKISMRQNLMVWNNVTGQCSLANPELRLLVLPCFSIYTLTSDKHRVVWQAETITADK